MWYWGKGKRGFWGSNPFETRGMRDFRDDRGQIGPWEEKGPQKKLSRRKGLCAHSLFKKKDGGGSMHVRERKQKKNIPGSSLIEAPDVAGVHQDKKKNKEEEFIKKRRKRKIIRTQGSVEVELVGG